MSLVQSVSRSAFIKAFHDYNREDNFSYDALYELFDYLDDLSDQIGEPIELDVIGICCEYHEISLDEFISDFSLEDELKEKLEYLDEPTEDTEVLECKKEVITEHLEYNGGFFKILDNDNIVYQSF